MKKLVIVGALLLTVLTTGFKGCYQQVGKGNALPSHIKTLAIPPFQNRGLRYKVEQRFTAAMIDEVIRRRRAIDVVSTTKGADAVMLGSIKNFSYRGALIDDYGRARVFEIQIVAGITVKDLTTNKIIFDNQNYVFKTEYEVTGDVKQFFNEEGPAVQRLAKDFAKSVLTTILEGF